MKKKLSSEWFRHLKTEEERNAFSDAVLHDSLVLGRLTEIIEGKLSGLETRETSLQEYDNPAWAYKQAHANGYRGALTSILELLPSKS